MGKVIGLSGYEVAAEGNPNENLIEALEGMLEQAKAGKLQGVVCATLYDDTTASYAMAGVLGTYSLIGALDVCKARLIADELEGNGG